MHVFWSFAILFLSMTWLGWGLIAYSVKMQKAATRSKGKRGFVLFGILFTFCILVIGLLFQSMFSRTDTHKVYYGHIRASDYLSDLDRKEE